MCTFPFSMPAAPAYFAQLFKPTVADDMRKAFVPSAAAPTLRRRVARGFTLIEVMIVVALIGILAAIALPSYRDYILRGQLVDASSLLSAGRANMERYFQDNRTYMGGPCVGTQGKFTLRCTTLTATQYTLQADGNGSVIGFAYNVTQSNVMSTVTLGTPDWPMPTPALNTCWIMKKGQVC